MLWLSFLFLANDTALNNSVGWRSALHYPILTSYLIQSLIYSGVQDSVMSIKNSHDGKLVFSWKQE